MLSKSFLKKEYYNNKKSIETIAKEIGLPATTIRNKMVEFNLPRRLRVEHKIGTKLSENTIRKIKESCRLASLGFKNSMWKGGLRISKGYVYILVAPRTYVKRCILVMEHMIGRKLKEGEVVHHRGINYPIGDSRNKLDDTEENLQLCEDAEQHQTIHNMAKKRVY